LEQALIDLTLDVGGHGHPVFPGWPCIELAIITVI
jgi:hypothetical protein